MKLRAVMLATVMAIGCGLLAGSILLAALLTIFSSRAQAQGLVIGSHVSIPIGVEFHNVPATAVDPFFLRFSVNGTLPLLDILRNGDVRFYRTATVDLSVWNFYREAGPFLGFVEIKLDGQPVRLPVFLPEK